MYLHESLRVSNTLTVSPSSLVRSCLSSRHKPYELNKLNELYLQPCRMSLNLDIRTLAFEFCLAFGLWHSNFVAVPISSLQSPLGEEVTFSPCSNKEFLLISA